MQAFFAAMRREERPAPFIEAESPRRMKERYRFYEDEVERATAEFRRRKEKLVAQFRERKNLPEDDPAVKEFLKELKVQNNFFKERDDPISRERVWTNYVSAKDELARLTELFKRYQPLACAVSDLVPPQVPAIADTYLLAGGELDSKGERVNPGFPEHLAEKAEDAKIPFRRNSSGRRLALAEWIASAENPLTARVMVNRLWQHHFSRGLIRTPSDFGLNGKLTNTEAQYFAERVLKESGTNREKQVERAFRLALSRPPSVQERQEAVDLLSLTTPLGGLVRLGVVLFNLNEFLYVE